MGFRHNQKKVLLVWNIKYIRINKGENVIGGFNVEELKQEFLCLKSLLIGKFLVHMYTRSVKRRIKYVVIEVLSNIYSKIIVYLFILIYFLFTKI